MFNLLRRSKNRKSKHQDHENKSNEITSHDALKGLKQKLEPKNLPKLHEKITTALENTLENFQDLSGNTKFEGKEITNDEREEKFAKIYFESSERKNNKNETFSASAEKETVGKSAVNFTSDSSIVSDCVSGSGSGRSSAAQTNDSSSTSQECRNLAKRKSAKRKSLDFRRVDLDGINSIIEAIVLNGEDVDDDDDGDGDGDGDVDGAGDGDNDDDVYDKESITIGNDRDYHQVDRPDSERSSVDLKLLSQNERAELSGRKSSTHSDVSKSDKLQSNVKNITSIASNKNELNATKSNGARNVRGIDQDKATTTGSKKSDNEDEVAVSKKVSIDNQKQIKRARRRSLFQRKSAESTIVESGADSQLKLKNSEHIEVKKSEGPLQKGKKLISNIFMARGRHHQNQRNRKQVPQQSSSKQLQHEPCSSKSNNQYAAVTTDHKKCQNDTSNKDDSTISDIRNSKNLIENDQNSSLAMLRRHLETSNSPNRQCDPAASVQMTYSNNNLKNASRRDVSGAGGKPHHRSNSAELPRERRDIEKNKSFGSKLERAYSEEPQGEQQRTSGANTTSARAPLTKERLQSTTPSDALHDVRLFTRARSIEQNGIIAEKSDSCAFKNTDEKTCGANDERADSRELTACTRHNQSESSQNQKQDVEQGIYVDAISMGQTYGKNETSAECARASTPREFRDSLLPEADDTSYSPRTEIIVPKITIEDFSFGKSVPSNDSPTENEVFYDFENEFSRSIPLNTENCSNDINNNEEVDSDIDDEVFHEQVATSQPASFSIYRQHSPLRHSPVKLEDVPEQEEEDEDEAIEDDVLHLRSERPTSVSASPERFPLKSSDSNLSNSYPDSGISGCSEPQAHSTKDKNDVEKSTARSSLPKHPHRRPRSPFVRDSTSTECDDTILQCDELDCFTSTLTSSCSSESTIGSVGDRLVCIESISLPDVVESTTSSPCSGNSQNGSVAIPASSGAASEQIININGSTGNSMGNVHFIPIHVESGRCRGGGLRANSPNQQKQRSVDDSVIGNGMNSSRFTHLNGSLDLSHKPTIEIIEDDEPLKMEKNVTFESNSEKMRLEFDEQKSRLSTQLDDAQKNVQNLQTKITEMQTKIENLEQEMSTKTWNVERLQSELNASQREDEFVRKKLRLLQDEKTELRHKYNENEDEFRRRYDELEVQYKELQEKYKNTQQLASGLHTQLATAQNEAEEWRNEVDRIRNELEEQIRILKNALENSEAERKICEDKWQKEFELLRTHHMDREETLMTDCEWQVRQMQKQWKDKLDKSEHARRDAIDATELLGIELETRKREVQDLRHYEAEVKSLRGVVSEQHNSISILMNQIENLKVDLEIANNKLEDQIEAVAKIRFQCDNTICDKERQMVYRIDEVRNEAACFWENKLYTEMTRLKNELESVYVDERREALDKLQAEHIEELRALTTRYTANEEELRTELAELQERLDLKSQEYMELRDKSDNALLQTRMHLDRADREYQNAMCREEERREALEETLRKEFEAEKQEMESKFHERLNQVKEEFAIELQNSKQEMIQKHQKNLEQLKSKLRAEKDQALQDLVERHRQRLAAAEEQMKEIELRHQNDLKELKATYDEDKAVLDKRDMSNANEIEQLHRRCRCLTNLFEEMRMRYERRDPRPEDLREIDELRTRCESQERDLFTLTATLREMQMQQNDRTENQLKKGVKSILKPPPKTIPTNCDVIYEENEEGDSPPPSIPLTIHQNHIDNTDNDNDNNDDDDDDDDDEDNVEENENDKKENTFRNYKKAKSRKYVNGSSSDIATNQN